MVTTPTVTFTPNAKATDEQKAAALNAAQADPETKSALAVVGSAESITDVSAEGLTDEQRKLASEGLSAQGYDPAKEQGETEEERYNAAMKKFVQAMGLQNGSPFEVFLMMVVAAFAQRLGFDIDPGLLSAMSGADSPNNGHNGRVGSSDKNNVDARYSSKAALAAALNSADPHTLGDIARLAESFIGEHERGTNGGGIVQLANGYEGDPWCGGFTNLIMDKFDKRLFDQEDFLSARSFEREAKEWNAFVSAGSGSFDPKVGDVVVFKRDGGKGHVGIVTGVDANGTVTYVAGNDGDAVSARTFDKKNPPESLLGYADVSQMAQNKLGVAMADGSVQAPAVAGTAHDDKTIVRG